MRYKTPIPGISCISYLLSRILFLVAHEEQGQSAGAGVGTDDRTQIADEGFLYAVFFLYQGGQLFRIFHRVGMAIKYGAVIPLALEFAHLGHQGVDGGFAATGFDHADQVTRVVHMENRLDVLGDHVDVGLPLGRRVGQVRVL